jgi:hypothetical protein
VRAAPAPTRSSRFLPSRQISKSWRWTTDWPLLSLLATERTRSWLGLPLLGTAVICVAAASGSAELSFGLYRGRKGDSRKETSRRRYLRNHRKALGFVSPVAARNLFCHCGVPGLGPKEQEEQQQQVEANFMEEWLLEEVLGIDLFSN